MAQLTQEQLRIRIWKQMKKEWNSKNKEEKVLEHKYQYLHTHQRHSTQVFTKEK
jgi:hypothetical protein